MNNNELKINVFGMNGSRRDAYIVTHHHKAQIFTCATTYINYDKNGVLFFNLSYRHRTVERV